MVCSGKPVDLSQRAACADHRTFFKCIFYSLFNQISTTETIDVFYEGDLAKTAAVEESDTDTQIRTNSLKTG